MVVSTYNSTQVLQPRTPTPKFSQRTVSQMIIDKILKKMTEFEKTCHAEIALDGGIVTFLAGLCSVV